MIVAAETTEEEETEINRINKPKRKATEWSPFFLV
jgi:hypothetical protein